VPALTYTYTGLANGDSSATFNGVLATTATSSSSVANYPITQGTLAAIGNYMIGTCNAGMLTVTPALLTITANNAAKVYGAAVPALSASYSGFVNGDTVSSLSRLPTLSTLAAASSHVLPSGYPITASGASDPNYTINYVSGTLTVTPAPLTIAANDATRVYGAPLPALTAGYSGWVNDDSSASLATVPTLSTWASAASHVGSYAITASGAVSSDYTISYFPGTLTVTPAPLAITANNSSKLYGAALPALTSSYTGFVNGESAATLAARPTLATTAAASSPVVQSGYAIIASGASDPDYSISYQPGTLLITPAPLTITANNTSMVQGSLVPALSASYSGLVNGETPASLAVQPTITTPATSLSQPGTYAIWAGRASSTNYAINYANGIFLVTPAPVKVLNVSVQPIRLGKTKKKTQVIVVQFSGALNPGDAHSTSNYTLTTIPANKRQKSQSVALSQTQYNASTNTVTLITRKPLVLNPPLRLTLNAARLLDSYSHSLSGNCVATLSKGRVTF
jgi:hypothetical protein